MTSRLVRTAAAATAWCVALLVFAFSPAPCPAALPYQPVLEDPLLEPWRWRTYLDLSGLDILCMEEDAEGTLWFGTANGLWSYDGIDWTRVPEEQGAGRIVTDLCRHPDGSLYAAGSLGISRLSRGTWNRVLSLPAVFIAWVGEVPIRKLAVSNDGAVWAATVAGILRQHGSGWMLYETPGISEQARASMDVGGMRVASFTPAVLERLRGSTQSTATSGVSTVCTDSQGRIWFGTVYGGVLCFDPASTGAVPTKNGNGTWSVYDQSDGLAQGAVTSILAAHDGSVWFAHATSDQADVFADQTWRSIQFPLILPTLDLADVGGKLLQTRDGTVWLSAWYKLFPYRDEHWRTYETPDMPFPSTRNAVMETSDGALWFSGPNSELYRADYDTARWRTFSDLVFQWESPEGARWFLHRSGRIVVDDGGGWTSYGPEDGLIDMPVAILGTRTGDVWAAGSHEHTAATARFAGGVWTRQLHEQFSFAVDWRATFESSDGSLWFGAFVDTDGPEMHRDGILQYCDGVWKHHHQPGRSSHPDGVESADTLLPPATDPNHPIEKYLCLGESLDGRLWAGRNVLAYHDGSRWVVADLAAAPRTIIECMLSTREGHLWVGSREASAFRWDGNTWQQFQGKDSLYANSIRSLAQTTDGSIWAATDRGTSRFDGRAWMSDVLPTELNIAHEGGDIKSSPSGALWINHYTLYWMRRAWSKSPPPDDGAEFHTARFQFQGPPPDTAILTTTETIAQPGNLAVLWTGVVPWRAPEKAPLQFSHRLDDGPWSPFTSDRGHAFFTLPDGRHHLQVRARDADFNVDPTPAILHFTVLPPVWRQGWFILLMLALGGLVTAQTVRMLRDQVRLREAHNELDIRVRRRTAELEMANRSLEAANHELEAFSYSVSHDLRSPLRSIDGFSRILLEDCADRLNEEEKEHLKTVRAAAQRMGRLIEDMLRLARIARSEMHHSEVNLSEIAESVIADLRRAEPERTVETAIAADCVVAGDSALLKIALENLLGNAWKYSSKKSAAQIEFGRTTISDEPVYFVRDNGAGFDPNHASKLFGAFQRLHTSAEFPGTGIGLAIVQRVMHRHGGRVWAKSEVNQGATFFFTLPQQHACTDEP